MWVTYHKSVITLLRWFAVNSNGCSASQAEQRLGSSVFELRNGVRASTVFDAINNAALWRRAEGIYNPPAAITQLRILQPAGAMADIVSVDTFSMPQDPVTCPSQLGTPQPPLDDFSVTPDELFRAKHAINANVHLVPSQLGGGCEPGLVPSTIDDVRWCRWFMVRYGKGFCRFVN